jgi:hypothetical protein
MVLVALLQAQNCSNYPASWRHRDTVPGFLTADFYQQIARTLEAGKFHLAFFDDRLGAKPTWAALRRRSPRPGTTTSRHNPLHSDANRPDATAMGPRTIAKVLRVDESMEQTTSPERGRPTADRAESLTQLSGAATMPA